MIRIGMMKRNVIPIFLSPKMAKFPQKLINLKNF